MTPPVPPFSMMGGEPATPEPLNGLRPTRTAFAGTLSPEERAAALEAFEQAQLGKPSVAVRIVVMAFARSAEVRDAVARWVRTHPEDHTTSSGSKD